MDKKISVIIPVYNTEKYLEECLSSLINSSYSNLEIICINDGSTDNSMSILKRFAETDDRIIMIDVPNNGVSAARNKGLSVSTGDYIAFVDSDDTVTEDYFEKLVRTAEKYHADIVFCGYYKEPDRKTTSYPEDLQTVVKLSICEVMRERRYRNYVWGKIIRRNTALAFAFEEDLKLSEDTIYNMKIYAYSENLALYRIPDEMYYYRQRDDSAVHAIGTEELINIVPYYLQMSAELTDRERGEISGILLERAIKAVYSYRYYGRFSDDQRKFRKTYRDYADQCISLLKTNKAIRTGTKRRWMVLLYCPFIYRVMMDLKDPELMKWEMTHYKEKILNKKRS